MSLKDQIRAAARAVGIDRAGFSRASDLGHEAGLEAWLARSFHGSMSWMARDPSRRRDPRQAAPHARTVVSVAVNYHQPESHPGEAGTGRISRYAWGGDYHRRITRQLRRLVDLLRHDHPRMGARYYVDTGPVLEKAWAHRAGVGWIGKHSNVITRDGGSWLFLGVLLLDADVEPDRPATDHCGSCTRCIDACPTAAIVAPTVVDSRRCISYLTIEHRGPIARELRSRMEDWIFGCDICQDVCPWNKKFARPSADRSYAPRAGNLAPRLSELARLDREEFAERFRGSNVRRAGWVGFLRNVMIALGNAPVAGARAALRSGLFHPEPLVRTHAAWGLGQCEERAARSDLERRAVVEDDPEVREEIETALAGAGAQASLSRLPRVRTR
jgi:epoxyqueuosine reductase